MIAPLATFIDWSAIQVSVLMMPPISVRVLPGDGQKSQIEAAVQLIKGPNFIPAESQPARLEFDSDTLAYRFPTPRPCAFPENNVVHGRLYRCTERWQDRPVIILLHGGGDFINHRLRFPSIARKCNRAGFNVATFEAPYHFHRRPRRREAFSSTDYLPFAEANAQAIAELRALTGWLLKEGCPAVALWGTSHGGWLAGMMACRDTRLASVVLAVPGVRSNRMLPDLILWPLSRRSMQGQRVEWEMLNATPLNLTLSRPVIARENILLIEGIYDLFAPKEPIEELWEAWGRPDIWRLPYGHVTWMCAHDLTGRVLRWLAPRLDVHHSAATIGRSET